MLSLTHYLCRSRRYDRDLASAGFSVACLGRPRYSPQTMARRSGVLNASLLAFLILFSFPAHGQEPSPLPSPSLDEMVVHADRIVQAQVVSTHVEPHPRFHHLNTVVVTLRVEDTLKGKPATTLQFRQYLSGWGRGEEVARYENGEDILLLLHPDSRYGLTSPVGLDAGRFRLQQQDGQTVATNGRDNVGLFRSTAQQAQKEGIALPQRAVSMMRTTASGPVSLDDLKETIRAFVKGK